MTMTALSVLVFDSWLWFEMLGLLFWYVVALLLVSAMFCWFGVLMLMMIKRKTAQRWFWYVVGCFAFLNGCIGFGEHRDWQVNATISAVFFLFFWRRRKLSISVANEKSIR